MSSLRTALVALIAPFVLFGCSEIFDSSDLHEVSVRAEMVGRVEAKVAILNHSNESIKYSAAWHCYGDAGLDRLEAGQWQTLIGGAICDPAAPVWIDPGERHTEVTIIGDTDSGEYRFRLPLWDEDGDLLPDGARTSNVFEE